MSITPEGWDWPYQITLAETQRVMDTHVIQLLERVPAEFRRNWQTVQLQRLLRVVRDKSPYWRAALPADAATAQAADLGRLPILGRAQFRERAETEGAMPTPERQGRAIAASTSGSTGMPVRFFATEFALRLARHHYASDHARQGRDMLRRWATLGPQVPAHPGQPQMQVAGQIWMGESDGVARNTVGTPLRENAPWVTQAAPAYLFTNPTLLSALLEAYEAGVPAPRGLEQVVTYGGTVEPALRERARRMLGARIADRYSCEEAGPLAWQCPRDDGRYHVAASNVILEVVDEAGQPCAEGEIGRVLVTALHHWASPVIRYDIGDLAALHAGCTCGAGVPSLSRLLGRRRGLIRNRAGDMIFVRMTAAEWLDAAPVREHRITQLPSLDFRVELVLAAPLTDAQRAAVLQLLRSRIDADLGYEIVELDAIDWPPGLKRQDVRGL